ncbi:hypothetical protein [Actinocatenispora thailandica]|nr:hypothetical protein [Actinocatenispora thailandica]
MYQTTGLSRAGLEELCAMINRNIADENKTWPPTLGLFKAVVVSLIYLRRNRVQQELSETFG